jgi:hypothetical protein
MPAEPEAMTRTRNLYASLLILAIAIAFQAMTYGLPANNRMVPALVGWIAIVLCVLDVIAHTETAAGRWIARVMSGSAHIAAAKPGPGLAAELRAFLWIALACAGVALFGFMWTIPVYIFAYTVIQGRKPMILAGLTALGATFSIWVAFELLLEYEIYRGLLFSDL